MKYKKNQKWKKLIAITMILFLLMSKMSAIVINTWAATTDEISFTIIVKDKNGNMITDAIVKVGSVTLMEKERGQYTGTVHYEEETEEEIVFVRKEGYVSEQKKMILTSEKSITDTITMELSSAELSGMVTDENGAAYEGAVVELGDKQAETDSQGQYSLRVEKGNYRLKVTAQENKYAVYKEEIRIDGDMTKDIKLQIKTFEIKTPSSLQGGSIKVSSQSVSYGSDVNYTVAASQTGDIQYLIASVTINNEEIKAASGQEIYEGEIKNITADQTIDVIFTAKESHFTLEFSDGDWLNEGEKKRLLGGFLSYEKASGIIMIELGHNYYLSKVSNTATNEEPKINRIDGRVSIDYGKIGTNDIRIELASDKTAPSIITPNYSHSSEWTKHTITIPVKVTDMESGIDTITYEWGKQKETISPEKNNCYQWNITIDNDYEGDCIVTAEDQCGNREEKRFAIRLDHTAPTITSVDKSPKQKYYNGSVKMKVQAEDKGAGVQNIYYHSSEDNLEPSFDEKNKIDVSKDGSCTIEVPNREFFGTYYIWVEDKLGNRTEIPHKIDINIDKTNPVIDKIDTSLNSLSFSNQKVTFSIQASDNISRGQDLTVYVGTKQEIDNAETGEAIYNREKRRYQFTIDKEKELREYQNQLFYVWAKDQAGNVSEFLEVPVNLDTTEPKVTGIIFEKDKNSTLKTIINHMSFGNFYNEAVHVKVTANDNKGGAGIGKITLFYKPSKDSDTLQPLTKPIYFKEIRGEQGVTADFVLTKDILDGLKWKNNSLNMEDIIYAAAEDNAGVGEEDGNISEPLNAELLVLEQNEPEIAIESVNVNDTVVSWKRKDYLCYGKDTKLIVTARDNMDQLGNVQSGIWKIKVTVNGAIVVDNIYQDERSTEPAPLTIDTAHLKDSKGNLVTADKEGFFHIQAETVDYASNKGISSLDICMDYKAPVIGYLEKSPKTSWSAGDVIVRAKNVVDSKDTFTSKVKEVRYSTGTNVTKAALAEQVSDTVYQFKVDEECRRVYSVWAIDKAGHISERKTIAVNIDKTAPEITKFSFQPKGYQESEGDNLKNAVESTDYGFYFKTDIRVTVSANDVWKDSKKNNRPSSGVKFIEYYAADKDGNIVLSGKKNVNQKNEITFMIPTDFKGQLYAKATDKAMNVPKGKPGTVGTENGYVHPDGSIVESDTMHKKSSGIKFNYRKSPNKDAKGQDLYKKKVDVEIVVSDVFSGIRQIEWEVTSPYDTEKNQKGTLVIRQNGKMTGDTDGWSKVDREKNIVTKVRKKITVSHNSNDIKIWVKLTDRAGNTSQKSLKFSIDKTAPKIRVTYNNNSYDKEFAKEKYYYKAGRTAMITITERNFSDKDVVISIKNTDGKVPEIGKWTKYHQTDNPEETTYQVEISYDVDGDYSFHIAYTDRAGNKAAQFLTDYFVIDKKAPVIQVTYNNNFAQNGRYYSKARTATITIIEKNFETSRIQINGSAKKSGKEIAFPKLQKWSKKGDTHTTTIHYVADGDYTFDIEYTDKAGNKAKQYSEDKFTIDQTKPKLIISGVSNESSHKGKVIPVISWSDSNLSGNAVITLTAYNQKGQIQYKGSYSNLSNGKRFTFADFEHKKEMDDIYTLTASVKDKAGNIAKQSIRFSVNRFGSVYTFAKDVKLIEGKYINREKNIVITETNVDKLNMEKVHVKVVKNGAAKNLVRNQDFVIKKAEKNGTWSQYIYTLYEANFTDEGQYTIIISSEDKAGNINETMDESEEAYLSFGIDKTPPVVVPVNIDDSMTYAENGKKIIIDITDNLMLKQVEFYLNGDKIKAKKEKDRYTFYINQSNQKQNVKIVAYDAAGNQTEKEVKDFYVTTNLLIRWYTNQIVFISTIAFAAVCILGFCLFLLLKKKEAGERAEKAEEEYDLPERKSF